MEPFDTTLDLTTSHKFPPQGLALVGGEITFFGSKGVQMLRNGEAWEHVVYQPEGTLAGSPAVLVLP